MMEDFNLLDDEKEIETQRSNKQNIDTMFRQLKAEQLGVDVADLKEAHVDGKRVFVSKKLEEPKPKKRTRQRSIRGSGSVVDDINRRLEDTEELIKDLESKKLIVGMESFDLLDLLGMVAEKTETAIHPLIELEDEIERRKKSVADYSKYHRTFIEVQKLRQVGDIKAAEEMEGAQGGEYREFRLVYRSMVPLLNQARELRLDLLREKRRLLNLQYNMMRKFLLWQVSEVIEYVENSPGDSSQYQQYLEGLKPWKQIPEFRLAVWKPGAPVANQVSLLESDLVKLIDQVDNALPTASEFINKIFDLLFNEINKEE
jgi:hypothetical protein